MILSLGLFLINSAGTFGDDFPIVFVAECAMLLIGGIACLIKGGLFLKDKVTPVGIWRPSPVAPTKTFKS